MRCARLVVERITGDTPDGDDVPNVTNRAVKEEIEDSRERDGLIMFDSTSDRSISGGSGHNGKWSHLVEG